ncbi:unnamed protein product [Symbiodinium necroappetens]|uniref:Uncharacterized protein n=1 Tax=Symbiodinium necroappetens TaxID=1628268 RepID=A0A813A6E2_9DINO|nr:unnamed protein product [Symbiodinium necroappetens]
MATLPAGDNVEARRRPLAPLWTDENIRHADSKGGALRPLQEEVAVRYKELVKREQALAAREQLASEVCQAQEEREQDLEALALRLQQQTEVGFMASIDTRTDRAVNTLLMPSCLPQ